jgi:hypothetical protein
MGQCRRNEGEADPRTIVLAAYLHSNAFMEQIPNYADSRQIQACAYCGGDTRTRDHVPSKVLLDEPFPENLPVVPACDRCNQSFSADEEYIACLLECVMCGSTEPDALNRPNIRRILSNRPLLRAKLEKARKPTPEGGTIFDVEQDRLRNIVLKLGRGHCAYELNEPRRDNPKSLMAVPFSSLTRQQGRHFEAVPGGPIGVWPEVGSRAFQRLLIADDAYHMGWLTVQAGRYRFMTLAEGAVIVRIVIADYLACEIIWHEQSLPS